jgi:predicted dehydrogenase
VDGYSSSWGIIGSSEVVEEFLKALSATNKQSARGVFSTNALNAQSLARKYQVDCHESVDDLINSPEIDSIYVASPNSQHFRDALQALNANKSVLIEKPCCVDSGQLMQLLDIAEQKNLNVFENMWICYLPGIQELVHQIRGGVIGEVSSVEIYVGFDSLGRRISMSKWAMSLRDISWKYLPSVTHNYAVPRNINELDRNDFLESVPHFSRKKNQGALMDFGIYGLSIIQLLSSNIEVVKVKSRRLNGVDIWTSVEFRENDCTFMLNCSLFSSERNFIRVKGTKGFVYMQDMFDATKFEIKSSGKSSQKFMFPTTEARFLPLLSELGNISNKSEVSKRINSNLLKKYKVLDKIIGKV